MFLLKKRYWLSLTLILTLALVAQALPASWVIYRIQQAVPQLQVSGVSGSPWKGHANFAQWAHRGQILPLGQLQWQLRWLSILSLQPCVDVSAVAAQQNIEGKVCYSLFSDSINVNETDIRLPISLVSPFFNIDLAGNIDAYIDQLIWQDQQLGLAQAQLTWQRAQLSNGSEWIPLGDIQASANDDGNGGVITKWNTIETQQAPSPVKIQLRAELRELSSSEPAMRITGLVRPGPRAEPLKQMLQFIGDPTSTGGYKIDINE